MEPGVVDAARQLAEAQDEHRLIGEDAEGEHAPEPEEREREPGAREDAEEEPRVVRHRPLRTKTVFDWFKISLLRWWM